MRDIVAFVLSGEIIYHGGGGGGGGGGGDCLCVATLFDVGRAASTILFVWIVALQCKNYRPS